MSPEINTVSLDTNPTSSIARPLHAIKYVDTFFPQESFLVSSSHETSVEETAGFWVGTIVESVAVLLFVSWVLIAISVVLRSIFFFFFFSRTSTFQLLDKPGSQVLSLLPPGSCLQFLSRIGFSNPTARRFFMECLANSRSRAFCKSICAEEKVPTNLYEYALGGIRTHETDLLYQAQG